MKITVLLLIGLSLGLQSGAWASKVAANRTAAPAQEPLPQWGYGYADLLSDIQVWKQSPWARIDSIGASERGRALWMVTITEGDSLALPRVFLHARTHPAEVQAQRVANAGIEWLLDTTGEAADFRRKHVVHFLPMHNPDGVEIGYPRENADSVDIESNWNHPNPEAEVTALRGLFDSLMDMPNPIRVALNLHSDQFNCTRFFVFHDSNGTSPLYSRLEQTFIGDVQGYFPGGFEPWFFYKTWSDGTKTQYPEGWWWTHFKEKVMALTYEDTNCPDASEFGLTARALLLGSAQYIAREGVGVQWTRKRKRVLPASAYLGLGGEARFSRQSRPVFRVNGRLEGQDLRHLIYFSLPPPTERP